VLTEVARLLRNDWRCGTRHSGGPRSAPRPVQAPQRVL